VGINDTVADCFPDWRRKVAQLAHQVFHRGSRWQVCQDGLASVQGLDQEIPGAQSGQYLLTGWAIGQVFFEGQSFLVANTT
jgi:hypothetical protein